MPLKKLSLKNASHIVDFYGNLLSNLDKFDTYHKYRYSDLLGYDIVDISNSILLMIAYSHHKNTNNDPNQTDTLMQYISVAATALLTSQHAFYPDEIVDKIKIIDKTDKKKALSEEIMLTKNYEEFEWNVLLFKQEHPEAFYKYCLNLDKTKTDYWQKVYSRLGISQQSDNETYITNKTKEINNADILSKTNESVNVNFENKDILIVNFFNWLFKKPKSFWLRIINKKKAMKLFEVGNDKFSNNNFSEAIDYYSKSIIYFPSYSGVYSRRAAAKIELKDYEGAIEDYSHYISLELNEESPSMLLYVIYELRGKAKLKLGLIKEAEKDFLEAKFSSHSKIKSKDYVSPF